MRVRALVVAVVAAALVIGSVGLVAADGAFVIDNSTTDDIWLVGEEVVVEYNITNTAGEEETELVELTLDGSVVAWEELTLDAGETKHGAIGFEAGLGDVGERELNLTVDSDFETHTVEIIEPILHDAQPKSGVVSLPVELSVRVENIDSNTTIEFRDGDGDVLSETVVDEPTDVTATWQPETGEQEWSVHALDGDGEGEEQQELDSDGPFEITVVASDDLDATREPECDDFEAELLEMNFVCAFAGPFNAALPIVVVGLLVWAPISMALFIRTGSPIIPYILLLLTGGVIAPLVAAPAIAIITVVGLAILGAVPVIAYRHYRRF